MSGPIDLGQGPADALMPPAPSDAAAARLAAAGRAPTGRRRDAVADVVRAFPEWPDGWAELGELARDDIEAYAYFRVGYHRGLDALRKGGWRGSGYVRWAHRTNRGFLRCLDGLRSAAAAIGETDEERRCEVFLRQLDPDWPPDELRGAVPT